MSSYIIDTSANGALLEDLNALTYTSINPEYSSSNIIPVLGTSYQLKNNRKEVVSNNFVPYTSPQALSLPGLMNCDASNVLYVANSNGSICKIVNNTLQEIVTSPRIFPNIPRGLVFDSSGILYVSAEEYVSTDISGSSGFYLSQIYKINKNGNLTIFNISGVSLNKIRGLAFDSIGNLYIVDQGNNCIIKVVIQDYNNGIGTIVVPYYIGFNGPTDIAFDAFNNMFITNTNNNNIIQVSSSGTITTSFSNLLTPCSLRFDVNGILYVTNFADATQTGGTGFISKIVNGNSTILDISGVTLNHPYGIAFDTSNNLYATNTIDGYGLYFYGDNQIYKVFIEYYGSAYYQNLGSRDQSNNTLGNITGLAFDINSNLYACEYYPPVSGDFPYNTYPPNSYISYNGVVYQVFNNNESNIYYNNTQAVTVPLKNPKGMVFDYNGYAYVINVSSNTIVQIAPGGGNNSGTILDISGAYLDNPSDLSFDFSRTILYVSDYLGNNVVTVNISTLVATVLTYTGVPINKPTGIFVDPYTNNIYLSNSGTNDVLLLTNDFTGYVSTVYNNSSIGSTIINNPLAISYDLQGIVYLSNTNNNQIDIITNNGFVSNLNIVFDTSYSLLNNSSSCIIYDNSNNLYISNQSNISEISDINPIIKVSCNVTGTQLYNSVINSFNGANYINSDSLGNLYVYSVNDIENNIKLITPQNVSSVYATSNVFPSSVIGMYFDNYQLLYILNYSGTLFFQISNTFIQEFYLNVVSPAFVQSFTDFKFNTDASNTMYIANANPDSFIIPGYGNILFVELGTQPNSSQLTYDATIFNNNLESLSVDASFNPAYLVFDSNGLMYITNYLSANIIGQESSGYVFNNYIYRLNVNDPNNGIIYAMVPIPSQTESTMCYPSGMTIDSNGYLYIVVENTYGYTTSPTDQVTEVQNIIYITQYPVTSTNSNILVPFYTYPLQPFSLFDTLLTLQYSSYENNLLTVYSNNIIDKLYLSFLFDGLKIGPYDDTLTINNVYDQSVNPITTFYVYNPYVVIDPSNIPVNTATNVIIHYVIPLLLPSPTDSYVLKYNNTTISSTMKNNATIVNPSKIVGSTYPTGICNDSVGNLYMSLQDNSISFVDVCGNYYSDFVPASYGLLGPSNLSIDSNNVIYAMNSNGTFISKIESNAQVVNVNNNFYTGVSNPLSLTYDYVSNDMLYLLTGTSPNFQITMIPIADPSNASILPLQLGSLYNPKGLVVDQFDVTGPKYLYVSNINSAKQNEILRINLSDGPSPVYYQIGTFITGLQHTPYSMTTKNDGFLYVNDTYANTISKISIQDPYGSSLQNWLNSCIYVPAASTFNIDGNLYVANSGTNPNNNKVIKVYVDYFEFTVTLNIYGSVQVSLYDVTTGTYVPNGTFTITTQ
jgi:DNA-binding beta-propeller fold protein YncE